jgi:uncharacterized protein (TIGR02466 family)
MPNNQGMEIFPLFSKLIGVARLNLSPPDLQKAQILLKKYKLKKANLDGTYISTSLTVLEDKKLNFLARAIDLQFQKYTRDFMQYYNSFKMTTSWITKLSPGKRGHEHIHRNNMISGVAYITCPPNCGNLTFVNKELSVFELPFEKMNMWNSSAYSFEPQPNTVVFFPTDMYHEVETNRSRTDRYSIAFNYLPLGEAGRGDSRVVYL